MATTKYILEKIKIEDALQDLLAKSNGENVTVTYNGTEQTLTAALAAILASITALPSGSDVDTKISTAISELISGAPETYDTLKEIADYIAKHETVVDTLNAAIGKKLDKSTFETFKSTVTVLGALAGKDKVTEGDLDTALADKVNSAAEGNHSHSNKTVLDGITAEKVAAWDGKAEKTEATAAAAGLMSAADKTRLDGLRGVRYGTEAPSDMQSGELFIRVITEA